MTEFILDESYTLDNFIGVFPNLLTSKECSEIVNFFESEEIQYQTFNRQVVGSPKIQKDDLAYSPVENALRNSQYNVTYSIPNWTPILRRILECYKRYIAEYSIMETFGKIRLSPGSKIQKTLPSGGYHVWHCEHGAIDSSYRYAAYTIYLNDVEEGGETEFLYQRKRIQAKQGSLCIFPASYTHTHRGNPPLSGVKYIMTGWFEFAE